MGEHLTDELRELIDAQHGIVSNAQLARFGIHRSTARSRVKAGRWQRLHPGVYATFSGSPSRKSLMWAAVLHCGAGAMLSHLTAAECAGLVDTASGTIHVTVPDERKVRRTAGIVVHRRRSAGRARHPARLPPQTRVEQTILDLVDAAAAVDDACSWVLRSLQRRTTTQAKLAKALAQRRRIRWHRELDELLTLDAAGLHSILELRYERDVERPHGLPRGERQYRYQRGRHNEYRDVYYKEYRTAVELDGNTYHPPETRSNDTRRDNFAAEDGTLTLRYGPLDIFSLACATAAQVARVLGQRGFEGEHPCSPGCPVGAQQSALPANPATPVRSTSRPRPRRPAQQSSARRTRPPSGRAASARPAQNWLPRGAAPGRLSR